MITPNMRQLTPSVVVAEDRSNDEPVRLPGTRVSLPAVWCETLFTFGDNAPSILVLALVGFAGPAIACILLSAVLRLDFYGQTSGPLATWLGIGTLRGDAINPVKAMLWLQAGLGAVGLAFARGVIAHIASRDTADAACLGLACRAAKACFPSLLLGSLVCGVVVATGAVGMNAVLHDTDLDLSDAGRSSIAVRGHATVLALRTLDAAVPSPGSPLAEFVPLLRHTAFEPLTQVMSTGVQGLAGYSIDKVSVNIRPDLQRLIVPMSVVVLILAEALLRFTPVMAMRSGERGRLSAITPMLRSVWFGIHHFGVITTHVWLLRLAFVAAYSVFFMLPVMLSQDVAPSVVRGVTSSVMGHWQLPLTLVCYWLVMAPFMAFSTVYDARLVLALERKAKSVELHDCRYCHDIPSAGATILRRSTIAQDAQDAVAPTAHIMPSPPGTESRSRCWPGLRG